jgi:hypothetical protein
VPGAQRARASARCRYSPDLTLEAALDLSKGEPGGEAALGSAPARGPWQCCQAGVLARSISQPRTPCVAPARAPPLPPPPPLLLQASTRWAARGPASWATGPPQPRRAGPRPTGSWWASWPWCWTSATGCWSRPARIRWGRTWPAQPAPCRARHAPSWLSSARPGCSALMWSTAPRWRRPRLSAAQAREARWVFSPWAGRPTTVEPAYDFVARSGSLALGHKARGQLLGARWGGGARAAAWPASRTPAVQLAGLT